MISHDLMPNQAASGNGAVASRFHAAAVSRAVPALRRWATSRMQISRIAAFAALVLTSISSGCFCKDTPREQKLADCTTNAFAFRLAWPTGQLFQVVLGVPYADTNALNFRGELVFRQSTGMVARVPVGSHDVTPCNWLDCPISIHWCFMLGYTVGIPAFAGCLSRRFPFGIYYDVVGETVCVYGILDLRRDPLWLRAELDRRT